MVIPMLGYSGMMRIFCLLAISLVFYPRCNSVSHNLHQTTLGTFPNGGFETNPTSISNGWNWPARDWVWDGNIAHSGTHSARVYRDSGSTTSSIWSEYISVQPSTIYTLTYWLLTENATYWPSVSIYQYTSRKGQTGSRLIAHANIKSDTSSWDLVTYCFQTTPDAATIQVRIYLSYASGTFWFDDFDLMQNMPAIYPFHAGFPVDAPGSIFYSSPVIADVNKDGSAELLIASGNTVYGWDHNGALLSGFPLLTNDERIQGQLAVADLDNDGDLEIVAGTKTPTENGQGQVFIWHDSGTLLDGWPLQVDWNMQYSHNSSWVSSVVLADINGDNILEVLAGTTNNVAGAVNSDIAVPNLYAWHINGFQVAGNWPNWHRSAGIYGFIAAGDLSGDGIAEVEVGRDNNWLNTYSGTGVSLPGWPIETYINGNTGRYDLDENIGYNLAAPIIADLEGDGQPNYIVAGLIGGPGYAPQHNSGLLVLEPDGRRRRGWETPALGNGILSLDDMSIQAPALADLDEDNQLELIVTTNDGWIRAYKPDKTILWAFNFTQGAVLGATEPVIGDIDGDGKLEVLFGTRVLSRPGGLYNNGPVGFWALKANGTVMPGFPLPVPTPGLQAAPTLADFDIDGKLEIAIGTREGEVIVWDTPTRYNSMRLPWPTGRHDLRRSATYKALNPLELSRISANPGYASRNEIVTFTIHIASSSPIDDTAFLANVIPAGISFVPGTLKATWGEATITGNVIHWIGKLPNLSAVEITYNVQVLTTQLQVIDSTAVISNSSDGQITRTANLYVNFRTVFLPVMKR